MEVRRGLVRWGLLVLLVLGVVLMHHVPGQHSGTGAPPPPSATSAELTATASDGGGEGHHAPELGGMSASSPHPLLHLCLAILIGFAAFLLARTWRDRGARAPRPGPGARARPRWTRPPTPTARRLAALCVLRC
ncbi:hypothetical protein ACL03H_22675 [Saccharopolyspora sp. MS10]|uniref:hypothetical protein n=1 Tax=Saccharopolyspora sp. MS10 TaxID=3385973 RepID=UPI0039A14AE0